MSSTICLKLILPFNHLDDGAFQLALSEFNRGNITYNNDKISTLHFNPFDIDSAELTLSRDLDPDINFFSSCHETLQQ